MVEEVRTVLIVAAVLVAALSQSYHQHEIHTAHYSPAWRIDHHHGLPPFLPNQKHEKMTCFFDGRIVVEVVGSRASMLAVVSFV